MIVSASRRSDLPAFHAAWLAERVTAGNAVSQNPFRPDQKRAVSLRPEDVDALVLWTRNPAPLLHALPGWEAAGLRTLWLVTCTGYARDLEPSTPSEDEAVAALAALARLVGRERIAWRYDPILLAQRADLTPAAHAERFAHLARRIAPHAGRVIVSFYDDYAAARRRLAQAGLVADTSAPLRDRAAEALAAIAREAGLAIQTCCEDLEGIAPGACIDGAWIDALWNRGVGSRRDPGQRKGCRCAPSVDIGVYGTCAHGCLYCYAMRSNRPGKAIA